jgi:hypothetical protein
MNRLQFWVGVLLAAMLSLPSPSARADTLDQVLQILHAAQLIDQGVVDAKPLVQCVIEHSPRYCINEGSAYLSGDDPKVKLVVDLIRAARASDWLLVLEITGTDVLTQVACNAGIPAGGAVKEFICSGLMVKVAKKAKPVVRQVLVAVKSGDLDDWLMVAAMTGPSLTCELMPSIPGKDAVCSVLGQVLGGAVQAVADAANAVWGSATAVGEWISGQDKHMPVETYYALYWKPWYHTGTLIQLRGLPGWGSLLKEVRDPCEDYFDSHTMSQDHAQQVCNDMRDRYSREVGIFVRAMAQAPEGYRKAVALPLAEVWAVTDHGKGDTLAAHRPLVVNGCEVDLRSKFPFPEPDARQCTAISDMAARTGNPWKQSLMALYQQCVSRQTRQVPQPSVWEDRCKLIGDQFANDLLAARIRVEAHVKQLVQSGACVIPSGWKNSDGAKLDCADYRGYQLCLDYLAAAHPEKRCSFDQSKADIELAGKVVEQLGGRQRCGRTQAGDIVCLRPWLQQRCERELVNARQFGPYAHTALRCRYQETPAYAQALAEAQRILDALNQPPAGAPGSMRLRPQNSIAAINLVNCSATRDPLALNCKDTSVILQLPTRLPGAKLPHCPPDPNLWGVDAPCYVGALELPQGAFGQPQTLPPRRAPEDKPPARIEPRPDPRRTMNALPDLQLGTRPQFAGSIQAWQTTVPIVGSDLAIDRGGNCLIPLNFSVSNRGAAASPPTTIEFVVQGQARNEALPALAPGAQFADEIQLSMPAGQHRLRVRIDPLEAIDELSETNNEGTVSVQIQGNCGNSAPRLKVRRQD